MALSDGRSLAHGAVVEARLCARLLGIKLLVIDGAVTLVPGRADGPVIVPPATGEVPVAPVVQLPGRILIGPGAEAHGAALGTRLEESARRLEASAHRLMELRPSR